MASKCDEPLSSVLITGSCSGEMFTATEVLICADTLGGEQAIRVWLARRGIHVAIRERIPKRHSARDAAEDVQSDQATTNYYGATDSR